MKLALLGADSETLEIARAAQSDGEHQVVVTCDVAGDAAAEIRRLAPQAVDIPHWEGLLIGAGTDAVLVARGNSDERAEQLRKLLATSVPVMVSSRAVDSLAVAYELEMIHEEQRVALVPALSCQSHPAVSQLAELVRQGTTDASAALGRVEQLVIEREQRDRSKTEVVASFLRDMELVRSMMGDLTQLGAMATAASDAGYASLGVQLACKRGVPIRWSVGPVTSGEAARFTFVGTSGKAILDVPGGNRPWRLECKAPRESWTADFPDWNPGEHALARLADAIAGRATSPNWMDVCRDLELAGALEQSVRRGRTVSLRNEAETEEGAFKSLMAAGGCLVLVLALLLLVASTALARFVDPRIGQFLAAAMIVAFLLLQLLKLVVPKRGSQSDARTPVERS